MKINGNLEVLGETKAKIAGLSNYTFDSDDKGLLFLDSNNLYLNTGQEVLKIETTNRLNALRSSLGDWVSNDFSFDALSFNEDFHTISGLNADSTLLDVLKQIDSSIPKTYIKSFSSASTSFLIEHNLETEIAHVVVKNVFTNEKVKDNDITITYLDSNTIQIDLVDSLAIKVLVSAI